MASNNERFIPASLVDPCKTALVLLSVVSDIAHSVDHNIKSNNHSALKSTHYEERSGSLEQQ